MWKRPNQQERKAPFPLGVEGHWGKDRVVILTLARDPTVAYMVRCLLYVSPVEMFVTSVKNEQISTK